MLKETLLKIGYKEKEIIKIINTYPLSNLKEETLLKKIQEINSFLIDNNYTIDEIIKMAINLPTI